MNPDTPRNAGTRRPVAANVNPPLRLSVLDRSALREGEDIPTAVRATIDMARVAERLGFHRFWVAEHHSVPGIAGSAPTVLTAAIASATTTIRVGTGGVMLPNHNPLMVAEQIGTLEALHPGRIDLGIGRSLGFTPAVRTALGTAALPNDPAAADEFTRRLQLLLGYLTGEQDTHPGVHARPGEGARPRPYLLATGSGADTAAHLGLPLVIAPVHGLDRTAANIARYRHRFTPSPWADRPHVILAQVVAVADTATAARDLVVSEAWSTVLSRTSGQFDPLPPPERVSETTKTPRQQRLLDESLAGAVYGTPEQVEAGLLRLWDTTGPDELLITTAAYDRRAQIESWRQLLHIASTAPTRPEAHETEDPGA